MKVVDIFIVKELAHECHISVNLQMSKKINSTATARLKQDFMRIMKDPVPYIQAAPLPSNILEW